MPTNLLHQRFTFHSYKLRVMGFVVLFIFVAGILPVLAGDSIYGKVTEVKSADRVVLDNGFAKFEIRIVGIDVPREGAQAEKAKELTSKMVLGKNARARLESRQRGGVMIAQLFTDDKEIGIKDVGVELVRAGLVRRQKGEDEQFGYKYNELTVAERAAKQARSGIWKK